jgi:hypothetical protein
MLIYYSNYNFLQKKTIKFGFLLKVKGRLIFFNASTILKWLNIFGNIFLIHKTCFSSEIFVLSKKKNTKTVQFWFGEIDFIVGYFFNVLLSHIFE